jgi:hypothetical protein
MKKEGLLKEYKEKIKSLELEIDDIRDTKLTPQQNVQIIKSQDFGDIIAERDYFKNEAIKLDKLHKNHL